MQITHVEVTPVELNLRLPYRSACHAHPIERIAAIFVRIETRNSR